MGKRNLYDNTSIKTSILKGDTKTNLDFLVYANGKNDLFDIANYLDVTVEEILLSFDILKTPLLALPYTGFTKDG